MLPVRDLSHVRIFDGPNPQQGQPRLYLHLNFSYVFPPPLSPLPPPLRRVRIKLHLQNHAEFAKLKMDIAILRGAF